MHFVLLNFIDIACSTEHSSSEENEKDQKYNNIQRITFYTMHKRDNNSREAFRRIGADQVIRQSHNNVQKSTGGRPCRPNITL